MNMAIGDKTVYPAHFNNPPPPDPCQECSRCPTPVPPPPQRCPTGTCNTPNYFSARWIGSSACGPCIGPTGLQRLSEIVITPPSLWGLFYTGPCTWQAVGGSISWNIYSPFDFTCTGPIIGSETQPLHYILTRSSSGPNFWNHLIEIPTGSQAGNFVFTSTSAPTTTGCYTVNPAINNAPPCNVAAYIMGNGGFTTLTACV